MCRHIIPIRAGLLPARRLRGEDRSVHLHLAVADHVLPPHLRDHTVHVARTATFGKVPSLHHAPRRAFGSNNYHGAERALPEAQHAQNGTMGPEGNVPLFLSINLSIYLPIYILVYTCF